MTSKRALVTGVAGQDGWYLKNLLETKGYEVVGIDKDDGDIVDEVFVKKLVEKQFDEIYNLASVATVAQPFENPLMVSQLVGMVPLYFLEAIRTTVPKTKFFQASSAEIFGVPSETPQRESTPFNPRTPYASAKVFAHHMTELYRSQNIFAVSGILFNHESPRRPELFVTRKITSTLVRISSGSDEVLMLGNLDVERDWSFAGDIVEGMYASLQAEKSDSYVFASGETHSVREFVETAANELRIQLTWEGKGEHECGKDEQGRVIVQVDSSLYRPLEIATRQGDIHKAKTMLGWSPKVSFKELVQLMVQAELS